MSSTIPAATGPAQAITPRGRFFASQTFHFETLRNAGYILSNCAELGEVLETVKVIDESDVQSWYAAWKSTADRVVALAKRTQDPVSKGGAYLRASTYQRTAEFLIPPDDPKRPESFEKTGSYFLKGLDTLGVRYERITVPYGAGSLRALYYPGPRGAETKPLLMFGGGFDSILEEYYPNFAEAALKRGYSVLTYEGPGQGEALRKYGLTYTAEWEKPVKAVLDEVLHSHAKPSKIVLIGMSMGGYFAPRAAAFEERIDGIVDLIPKNSTSDNLRSSRRKWLRKELSDEEDAVQRGANHRRAEADGGGPKGRGPGARGGRERRYVVRLEEQVRWARSERGAPAEGTRG